MASSAGGSDVTLSSSAASAFAVPLGCLSSDPSSANAAEKAQLTTDSESDQSFDQQAPQRSMQVAKGIGVGSEKTHEKQMKERSLGPW